MCDSRKPLAIFLMGPTASGKTALAVELVRKLSCEIISVDSALVYRGMDIGTAKPDARLLAEAPHRLIDFLDPVESYSAARFREDALAHMAEISSLGRIPLLVGGTGLYFRSLEQGLSELPSADPAVRAYLEAEAAQHGWPAMHERLAGIDPESAARIHPNDPQRIERALEVYEISGKSMSELYREQRAQGLPYRLLKFVLMPEDRGLLHRRIEQRFVHMMEQGFLDEVRGLFDRGDLHADLPSMRAVGYRQLWSHLQGECSLEEAVEKGIIATRQYAKRQITWLRAEQNVIRLRTDDENNLNKVLKCLEEGTI